MAKPSTNWTGANINALGNDRNVVDVPVFMTDAYNIMMFELSVDEVRMLQHQPRLCVMQLGQGIRPIALGTEEQMRGLAADYGKVWPLEHRDNKGQTPNEAMIEVLQTQNRLLTDLMIEQEKKIAALQQQINEVYRHENQ